jgi:hypothetical protein
MYRLLSGDIMNFKEYKKLMSVPLESLTEEYQLIRMEEFRKRMDIFKLFIEGMVKGYISDDIGKDIPDDDPIQDVIEVLKAQINEIPGEA